MARTIKTTLELGGEAAYKKGLQSVDRALKAMSAEVKEATDNYTKNSKSQQNAESVMESYRKLTEQQKIKVDSLKEAVETCTKKHEAAAKAYEEAASKQGENSAEALKAADALMKAEKSLDDYSAKLKSAEKYLNETNTEMDKFEKSAKAQSSVSKNFESVSHQAKVIKEQLKPVVEICGNIAKAAGKITFKAAEVGAKSVSTAINGAKKAFIAYTTAATGAATAVFATIESTREYRNDLAKLEQGAKTAGNNFDVMKKQLVNLTALTGESDSSIEALSNLMSTGFSDKQITAAVESLSGAVIKFPDTLKIESLADSLQETIATGAGTGQFAELIERSGTSLDDFNIGLSGCTSEAERQQYALQWLADSGLAKVNEEYEKSHKALLDYEKAEQAVTDANAKIANSAMPISASFKKGYAGVLSAFADVISGVDKTGADFSAKISAFLNDVVNIAVQYLPVLLTAVNTVIQTVATNLPTLLTTILPSLFTGFNSLITGLIAALPDLIPILLDGFTMLFGSLIDSVNLVIEQLMPMLPEIITQISEALITNLPTLLDGALQLFLGLIQSLSQVVEQLMPMLPQLITDMCDTLIANIDEIISAGFDLLIGLIDGITECIPTLLAKLPEIIDKLVSSLTNSENLGKLIDSGVDLIVALAEGLPKAIPSVVMAIPQIITSIIGALMEQDWLQVGIDIIKGIANGLVEGVSYIGDQIQEMASGLLSKAKNALGIHSPSKLFRDEVGIFLAQGLGVGFVNEMDKVTKDMQAAIPTKLNTAINADITTVSNSGSTGNHVVANGGDISVVIENANVYGESDIKDIGYKIALEIRQQQMALGY